MNSKITGIETSDGTIVTDPAKMSNVFNDYFATVFTKDDGSNPPLVQRSPNFLEEVTFTPDVVFSTLRSLRMTKSCGPDGIPNILLKAAPKT